MVIVGIHDGHNAGATLIKNGVVMASVSEERITRKKNEVGFPKYSINEVLNLAGLQPSNVDHFVYASEYMHPYDRLENLKDWYKVGKTDQLKDKQNLTSDILRANLIARQDERRIQLAKLFKVEHSKISFAEHHHAHAAAAYYGSHFSSDEKVLVITCDGSGDGLCATVSIGNNLLLERKQSTPRKASLGKIYSRVTFALGLQPWEHEYKVMGLAPYADKKYAEEIKDILSSYLKISDDGLNFECPDDVETNYLYESLRSDFELKRFDAISGGVQMFTEELLVKWISNLVDKYQINKIACGGGVFMNVKANKLISEIKNVEEMFVFPSCGDESLSFGAAWIKHFETLDNKSSLPGLPSLYLGRSYSDDEIREVLSDDCKNQFTFAKHENIEKKVAKLISKNKIVARFSGRMEWGARALGNRSILTNPKEWPNVERINSMIKMRDFWMPFAPSILFEQVDKLLQNSENIFSPHMMHAFDTVTDKAGLISAATHPRDKTARAQMVTREHNAKYWKLINYFYELSGIPCVLSTSFNLHGFPLVDSPQDALYVFKNSGLEYLALENYLVTKLAD